MGLDNYWKKNVNDEGLVKGEFKVCGGICSGNGNDSFRGKVYNNIVEEITGVSLYEEKISKDVIWEMNEKIQKCDHETAKSYAVYELREDEWADFQKMWDAHTKAGHYLVSWW